MDLLLGNASDADIGDFPCAVQGKKNTGKRKRTLSSVRMYDSQEDMDQLWVSPQETLVLHLKRCFQFMGKPKPGRTLLTQN